MTLEELNSKVQSALRESVGFMVIQGIQDRERIKALEAELERLMKTQKKEP